MAQTAKPDESAFDSQIRDNNDARAIDRRPPNAGLPTGDSVAVVRTPLIEDWEWHMQSREGSIRFRTGPDDPRQA